ncbi:MAG TPA: hypothetical protein VHX61_18535 [Rhizomicrobium sp.]|jgi:hypothetical protein|nr:hypothetical protein [Rhizomicrobium sp.]
MSRIGNVVVGGNFGSVMAMAFVACLCLSGGSAAAAAPAAGKAKSAGNVGLGQVLTSEDGEQIFGFDIDQSGDDGVLATANDVETFDQNTGKIKRAFGKALPPESDYVVNGIAGGDVALIEVEKVPQGKLFAHRHYEVINPVAGADRFTGTWTPPLKGLIAQQMANDQNTQTSLLFALTSLKSGEAPELIVSDVAANSFSNVISLDPNLLCLCDGPQLGLYTAGNKAVFALSPDGGAVGGDAPVNLLIDLTTGKTSQFNGYNNGFYHAGSLNGLAVDPNTGIAATTTELNSQVEFYDLKKKAGITFAQLPCTSDTDQTNSGSGVAVDPVNKLFLVADPFYCDGTQGGAVVVYDEAGNYVESITGFNLALGEGAPAMNPGKRMGWAFSGPNGLDQLQQFFY